MKRIIQLLLSLMLPLCSFAGDGFIIKGKVTGIISGYVSVIVNNRADGSPVHPPMPEKVRIVNGEFTYAGTIDRPDWVTLKISTKSIPVLLENVNYEINCSFDSLKADKLKGGLMNDHFQAYQKSLKKPLEYVLEHPDLEFSAWMAYFYLTSLEDCTMAEKALSFRAKASPNGQLFMYRMETFRKTAAGTTFPALKMTGTDGKAFNVADMKGKVVVLDFWASWCTPCIAFIPKLREHYRNFKDKDVVFVSVSVDDDVRKWQNAMAEQAMEWNQVLADGAFRKGEGIQQMFNISSIPYVIIVDRQGKIAASLDYIGKETLKDVLTKLIQ
ncbi:TlpA disulfide reductase family protein [uncultured Chitinophaga sp.]|uniref:TlpA disulfide reductase family protein n=1 Tax=uncultured Chitinophaga sp. TaxID=339340 RepID=UPI0025F92B1F|nr:TlpA disulfide reductase family protein [uncultured Chitinophaga sp.]